MSPEFRTLSDQEVLEYYRQQNPEKVFSIGVAGTVIESYPNAPTTEERREMLRKQQMAFLAVEQSLAK